MAIQLNAVRCGLAILGLLCTAGPLAHAAEHVILRNGFELNCVRRETVGDKVRLYLSEDRATPVSSGKAANYIEVSTNKILEIDSIPDPSPVPAAESPAISETVSAPTQSEIHEMLAHSGAAHHIDTDLLASVIKAESGGHIRAVSRTGAQGLMQLMPGTATDMGVQDAFRPEQNIAGGTAYLDELLTRYRDNIALALAAYNAGPAAVDRFHGVPPYRETQEYVARVIREFNRRKQTALVARVR